MGGEFPHAAMDDRPLQVVLAGRHGVGKSFIFEKLPNEAERYGSDLFTVDTGTGPSLLSGRDKWMVHVKCSGGKDTTVRLAGEPGKTGGKLHEVCTCCTPYQVLLWDTGGMEQEGERNMSRGYFNRAHAVIFVYDTGDMQSLTDLQEWLKMVREYCKRRQVVLSLWGHHRGTTENPVDIDTAQKFAAAWGIPSSLVFEVCASSGKGLVESFKAVVERAYLVATDPHCAQQQLSQTVRMRSRSGSIRGKQSTCCYN